MAKPPILAIIIDGVGDRPHPDHKDGTPLSLGNVPNLDALAKRGMTGLIDPLAPGVVPGSSSGHLALFDLDPFNRAPTRGAVEALGLGVVPHGDTYAARGNFVTLDEAGNVTDRRAGRFKGDQEKKQAARLIADMNEASPAGVSFLYDERMGYRFVVKVHAPAMGSGVSDTDPGGTGKPPRPAKATDGGAGSERAAKLINEAFNAVRPILLDHPVNADRREAGLPLATGFVTRGFGRVIAGPTMQERFGVRGVAVAGGNAYRGLARYFGLDLVDCKGATGDQNADFEDKVGTALTALDDADFCYLHLKSPDMLGEDGDFVGKMKAIEKIDRALAQVVARQDIIVGITGDHSTPCVRKAHSGDPVPLLFAGPGVRPDHVTEFNEFTVYKGSIGRVQGGAYLRTMMDLSNRTKKTE